MKQKILSLLLMAFIPMAMMAYDCEVNGIYYNLNSSDNTANVTFENDIDYNSYSGDVVIPASFVYEGVTYDVTSIGRYAFFSCVDPTSVTIPNSVTSIEEYAFASSTGLTSVTIPNSVTSIGQNAFNYCPGLTSITIPSSVTSIEQGTFGACAGLTSITIPSSVTSIYNDAFYGCTGLTSMKVESGNTKYDSRNNCNAIIETSSNTLIAGCKNTTIPNNVTSIGEFAFMLCSSLISINIPNSVTSIGNSAFSDCTGLTSITIPSSVTSIEDWAFSGCTSLPVEDNIIYAGLYLVGTVDKNLSSYTIKEGTKWIGSNAFFDCSNMTSITIPSSVTSIGTQAFAGCI